MARELVWTGFISLDGIVDSPGGTAEGHPGGGWVFRTPFDPESFSLKGEELAETTALMFGRRSYEAFASVWPQSDDHAAYRDLPKYVVSTTLDDDALVDGWGEQHILRSVSTGTTSWSSRSSSAMASACSPGASRRNSG